MSKICLVLYAELFGSVSAAPPTDSLEFTDKRAALAGRLPK